MKKITTLFAFLCMLLPCMQAQTEFSNNSSKWFVNCHEYDVWEGTGSESSFCYHLGKDTLLLNETWKTLYMDSIPVGAFQENGLRIYYYSFDWPEEIASQKRLFYDFSKEEGDTVYIHNLYELNSGFIYSNRSEIPKNDYETEYSIVHKVEYKQGRKIIYINNDCWIEGIGSPSSFFFRFIPQATGYTNISLNLHQMVSGEKTIYYQGHFINPDYQPTFLKEGKTWYVKNGNEENTYFSYKLLTPNFQNGWPLYPLQCNNHIKGYLYDINGDIMWIRDLRYPQWENIFIYNFSLKLGQKINLWDKYSLGPPEHIVPQSTPYTVSAIDSIIIEGKQKKRIHLDGPIPQDWIEGIGSTRGLLYTSIYILYGDYNENVSPNNELTCCYLNGEPLYQNPNYLDCTTSSIEQNTLSPDFYRVENNQLTLWQHEGYQLSIFNTSGQVVCKKQITGPQENINLQSIPENILICKLQNKDASIVTFKIIKQNQ